MTVQELINQLERYPDKNVEIEFFVEIGTGRNVTVSRDCQIKGFQLSDNKCGISIKGSYI